jgi:hypothetical protein
MRRALAYLMILAWLAQPAQAGVAEAEQALKSGDEPAAVRELTPLAERGQVAAQFNLGLIHARSVGAVRDLPAAYKWFSCAANGASDPNARATALKWRDYVKGIMRQDEARRAETMTAAPCIAAGAPAAPSNRPKDSPAPRPDSRAVKAADAGARSTAMPVAARGETPEVQKSASQAAQGELEHIASNAAKRTSFDFHAILAAAKPVALFMGELTVEGILQMGYAVGAMSIVGFVNRLMSAYGGWFTGTVSLAWWIVAVKSLHLLFTRRRYTPKQNPTTAS